MVGRVNSAKLANVPGIDILVLIACPETSLSDSRDFIVPVITPFEMECALHASCMGHHYAESTSHSNQQHRVWTEENFCADFQHLLEGN